MVSILNNITSLAAQRNLNQSQKGLDGTIRKLSTGLRINRASDDAAGLQISNNLRADIRILAQARRNANDGIGIIQIADGVLEEVSNILTRSATLAEQAASGTTASAGRVALDQEYQQILIAINELGLNTKYDGKNVFRGSGNPAPGSNTDGTFDVQVGDETTTDVQIYISTLSATNIIASIGAGGTSDLLTRASASAALGDIQAAISQISALRGNLGAQEARLQTIVNSLGITMENTQGAESQIRDADIAEEVVNLTKFQILTQSGVASLAQANQSSQSVLSLLQ